MQPISDAPRATGGERGGDGDGEGEERSTPRPFVTVRRVLVSMCWLGIAVTTLVDPPRLFLAGPVTGLAFLMIAFGSLAELWTAFPFKEQRSRSRLHIQLLRALLVLLASCSIVGAITSITPSMAYLSESGGILYEHGLSGVVAPTLWATILCASISAIIVPSPRRLALAAGAGLASWPPFLAIRLFCSRPFLDFDDEFLLLMPWVVHLYVVAAFVASGLAIALAFGAAHLTTAPVMQMLPRASVASRADRPPRWRPRATPRRTAHARPRVDAG